jgi:plasmid maintenance system killer protein
VKINFKSNKLEKQLTIPKEMHKAFGQMAKMVNQRMKELKAADNLAVMRTIPAAKCHELTQNRKGQLAVKVSGNYRLIFYPDHDPVPSKADGGMEWSSITIIEIIEIEDYHNS